MPSTDDSDSSVEFLLNHKEKKDPKRKRKTRRPEWAESSEEEGGASKRPRPGPPLEMPNMGGMADRNLPRLTVEFWPELRPGASIPSLADDKIPEDGDMGNGPDELLAYWRAGCPTFPGDVDKVDFTEALVGQPLREKPLKRVQIIFMNPNGYHWVLLAIDRKARAYAYMGSRRMDHRLITWCKASGIEFEEFVNVSPVLEVQGKEDCGARAAVFGKAFVVAAFNGTEGVTRDFAAGNVFNVSRVTFAKLVARVSGLWKAEREGRRALVM